MIQEAASSGNVGGTSIAILTEELAETEI